MLPIATILNENVDKTRVTDQGGGGAGDQPPTKIRNVVQLSAKFLKILRYTLKETGFLSFLRLYSGRKSNKNVFCHINLAESLSFQYFLFDMCQRVIWRYFLSKFPDFLPDLSPSHFWKQSGTLDKTNVDLISSHLPIADVYLSRILFSPLSMNRVKIVMNRSSLIWMKKNNSNEKKTLTFTESNW